jgi:hypothetical protein
MEYGLIALVGVIVSFVSWCIGVRMGAAYAARRIIEGIE